MVSVISTLVNDVKNLMYYVKRWGRYCHCKKGNYKSVERLKVTEGQGWSNPKNSWFESLEVISIPISISETDREPKVCHIFKEIYVEVGERYIQAGYCLKKDKDGTLSERHFVDYKEKK